MYGFTEYLRPESAAVELFKNLSEKRRNLFVKGGGMCAKKVPSAEAEIVRAVKPNGRRRFYRDASCRETPGYRARNPGGSPPVQDSSQ